MFYQKTPAFRIKLPKISPFAGQTDCRALFFNPLFRLMENRSVLFLGDREN
jgi:hypothetical protein